MKEYKIEKIKFTEDDLFTILGYMPKISDSDTEAKLKVKRLSNKLQENNVKIYRLININRDKLLDEYLYLRGEVTGSIRCYETENDRFIISCYGCD